MFAEYPLYRIIVNLQTFLAEISQQTLKAGSLKTTAYKGLHMWNSCSTHKILFLDKVIVLSKAWVFYVNVWPYDHFHIFPLNVLTLGQNDLVTTS